MKVEKPNWTPIELNSQMNRWRELMELTEGHNQQCLCNYCLEDYRLFKVLDTFTEDEKAGAVIAANKELESEFIRPEKPIETRQTY
jgi:hypothetical protein